MGGRLRIIGGEWGGRRLTVPSAGGLRPTADRNRETLFNWLQGRIEGARVLDLFAGTGALGLEALSRGAAEAVFVERSRRVAEGLRATLVALEAGQRARVVTADARRFLTGPPAAFDLVFLDPPFRSDLLAETLPTVLAGDWLADDPRVYVEADRHAPWPLPPPGWTVQRERRSGTVRYALLSRLS
ncbi:16S rRNA (guanine(966)-N(2))-methyltransferase RsmD [Sediminicurvatus halobius]|uniref:Ribosomal RNA small subunit methyltransferase D n=1 Tax=Sediminicurvatus halobius TaxID=2182432 RepID=A0A2U2N1X8_9GAMM|nr:16S rRNA (guanine(966)-N(2))-methyltransferase RsmD [Spiribacter halobius]PWG63100.1 16S rRNA (guanine(966)-N(2))-methyltransferase RsmD [Spiribacter halobius]UEX77550.1 16S rRNA (guanine(966)-N(2))-methyltransferase RsmD [Spiribacter halobius]